MSKSIQSTIASELAPKLAGEVIFPSDPTYDEARKVYNGRSTGGPRQ